MISRTYISTTLLYLTIMHLTYGTSGENHQQIIRGLFDILSSSSSQGQASIGFDTQQSGDSSEQVGNDDSIVNPSLTNHSTVPADNSPRRLLLSTTESLLFNDSTSPIDTSNLELPEPELMVPRDSIIKTRVMGERELEKSHTDAKLIRIEQVKSALRRKLRLDRLPDPRLADLYSRFPQHILQGMDNERRMQMDEPEKEDNYHAKIDQMIRFSQQVPQEKSVRIAPEKLNSTLYFPMPFSVTEDSLETATLLIYVHTPAGYEGQQVTLNILTNPWSKTITARKVTLTSGGHWEHIDITDQSKSWLRNEWKNNLGLVAVAEIAGINLVNYNNNYSASNESFERLPLVKLKLNEKKYNNRNRRSISSDLPLACDPEDNERRCCRYPFVLDFDELGPDFRFIISPKRYWANYCKGVCPEYILPNTANIHLTRGVNKAQRCCSPSAVDSLTLIYMTEDGNIMRGVIPGMSITTCGCD